LVDAKRGWLFRQSRFVLGLGGRRATGRRCETGCDRGVRGGEGNKARMEVDLTPCAWHSEPVRVRELPPNREKPLTAKTPPGAAKAAEG